MKQGLAEQGRLSDCRTPTFPRPPISSRGPYFFSGHWADAPVVQVSLPSQFLMSLGAGQERISMAVRNHLACRFAQ